MLTNQNLTDFQRQCQQYYICYVLAFHGLSDFADKVVQQNPDAEKAFIVGTGHPETGHWQASIKIGDPRAVSDGHELVECGDGAGACS